jgi:hypothetical protein
VAIKFVCIFIEGWIAHAKIESRISLDKKNILPVDLEEIEGEEGTVFEGCEYFNSVPEIISLDVVYCELK